MFFNGGFIIKTNKILNKALLSLLFATAFVSNSYAWNFKLRNSKKTLKIEDDFNSYKETSIVDVLDDIIDYTGIIYSEELEKELPRDLKFII